MDGVLTDSEPSPWHRGELDLQRRVGVAQRMYEVGQRNIRDYMPDQHRVFFHQLPFIVLGAVDRDGEVWATLIAGKPGFIGSPTDKRLHFEFSPDAADPALDGFNSCNAVGALGIELHSRRRNRVNGNVSGASDGRFDVDVTQSFGNCPQYIQLREMEFVRDPGLPFTGQALRENVLSDFAKAWIRKADTFFVASYIDDSERRQVDVSHRGGKAGFVRVGDDGVITVPDFAGNLFFATLGNFLVNPRAGLVFANFESGDLLQLIGDASVDLDSPEIAAFEGAERLWHFTPRRVVYRPEALPLRWKFLKDGWSPNSLMTGSWEEAESRLKAAALANSWRKLRVSRIEDESSVIRSFYLESTDGAGLTRHEAGQHLPIRVTLPSCERPTIRTYTLSSGPADPQYRISVRRQGPVSGHLHSILEVGSVIEARAPAGQFAIDPLERRPAVLLGAGVGVTPMLAMLRHVVHEGLRTRRIRPTTFFYSARTLGERAFSSEISELARAAEGKVMLVRALTNAEGAREKIDFDAVGRLDVALICRTLLLNDYDFYLCGPASFMQAIYDGLRDINIADERIHAEAFGPAGLSRRRGQAVEAVPAHTPSVAPVPVAFVTSGKEARWTPESGSLLDLAESRGLFPEYGCRSGSCGTCRTRISQGAVAYVTPPAFHVPEKEALICCAVPASPEIEGYDRLLLDV
jgi:ferredoxin-NADP reductase/predicted pyridoxine 5'-phosphate oxidase superfamily flavin-nucleotide-binding protein